MARVTVIMGIYNCSDTLGPALDSLLAQTFKDWDLIMCDDGSSDATYDVAERYRAAHPEKMVLLKNERNMGLNHTLNRCLASAEGEYIARQDGDDLSMPTRFEKEVLLLDARPEIAIVSTAMTYFDESGTWGQSHPVTTPQKEDFVAGTPFCHAPCMVRRMAYQAVGGYTEEEGYLRVEDYDLWIKMYAAGFLGRNISEPLYAMRDDRSAYSRRRFKYRVNEFRVRIKAARLLHLPLKAYLYAFRPIVVGLLPQKVYETLHKKRLETAS